MELRHLRYFVAVAETCHFGRAAEQLHLAQPALSQTVRQLEAELGVTLFNRTTRQVQLTEAGTWFLREAQRVLAGAEASVAGVRRIAEGREGLLRLGLVGTATFSHLPSLARALRRELPGVALDIRTDMLTPLQCQQLRDGAIDLAVLRPPLVGDQVQLRSLGVEALVLAVPQDHRLAVEPVLQVSDLRTESFITYANADSAVNQAVLRACRGAGFAPRGCQQAPGTAALLALVSAGLGVALVPASAQAMGVRGVVFRELLDAGELELCLAWRQDNNDPLLARVMHVWANDPEVAACCAPRIPGGVL